MTLSSTTKPNDFSDVKGADRSELTSVSPSVVRMASVCVMPPPVTGMSLGCERFLKDLVATKSVEVAQLPLSSANQAPGRIWKLMRALKLIAVAPFWMKYQQIQSAQAVYMAANAGYGQWLNVWLVLWARLFGLPVWMHHQVFSYITQPTQAMRWICAWMGRNSRHIMLSTPMIKRFKSQYQKDGQVFSPCFVVANPADQVQETAHLQIDKVSSENASDQGNQPLCVGYLSNITEAKGIGLFLKMAERYLSQVDQPKDSQTPWPIRFSVAGPLFEPKWEAALDTLAQKYPGAFKWVGPKYGQDKQAFLQEIDVFVFPTQYKREAYPLVLVEAMLAGCAVVSTKRGCIPELVGLRGVVLDEDDQLIDKAIAAINRWQKDRDSLRQLKMQSCRRGQAIQRLRRWQVRVLLGSIHSETQFQTA